MDELWWITISIIIHRWNHNVSYIRLMMWLSLAMSWLLSSYVNLPGMGHGNAFETWSSRANSCFKTLFCIWLTFKFVWIYIYIYGPVSRVPTPPHGMGGGMMPLWWCIYIHTYIPTYLPTYLRTYIHTYHYITLPYITFPYLTLPYLTFHTYIHTITLHYLTLPYLTLPYIPYIHTIPYHTYILTYIHTYLHTYQHTNIPTYQHTTTTGHRGGDQKNHTTTTGHRGGDQKNQTILSTHTHWWGGGGVANAAPYIYNWKRHAIIYYNTYIYIIIESTMTVADVSWCHECPKLHGKCVLWCSFCFVRRVVRKHRFGWSGIEF